MQALLFCGRVLLVLTFAFAGAQKLLNIAGTASVIASKVALPPVLAGIAGNIEAVTGMSMPQFLAILTGALELAAAVLIVFNVGVRPMTFLLIIFTAVGIYFFNDFWNVSGDAQAASLVDALQNISIIGALVILLAIGSTRLGRPERLDEI